MKAPVRLLYTREERKIRKSPRSSDRWGNRVIREDPLFKPKKLPPYGFGIRVIRETL
jgi:hypothetical protein